IDRIMQETGYSTNASRSPAEIAARLKAKLALAQTQLDGGALLLLREFLTLHLPLGDAPAALAGFADAAGLDIGPAIAQFDARLAALAGAGIDLAAMVYRAAFGRPLDYYTGLVFEATQEGSSAVLAGGGRYDRLMTLLGATDHIPAVGFSPGLDRVETARASRWAPSPSRCLLRAASRRIRRRSSGARAAQYRRSAVIAPIAAGARAWRASRSPICRPRKSPASLPAAPSISASPARTWCARAWRVSTRRSNSAPASASAMRMSSS